MRSKIGPNFRVNVAWVGQVLIDVNMPVMNGFETLSRIKSSPELWHIPVILMSSDDKADDGGWNRACSVLRRCFDVMLPSYPHSHGCFAFRLQVLVLLWCVASRWARLTSCKSPSRRPYSDPS